MAERKNCLWICFCFFIVDYVSVWCVIDYITRRGIFRNIYRYFTDLSIRMSGLPIQGMSCRPSCCSSAFSSSLKSLAAYPKTKRSSLSFVVELNALVLDVDDLSLSHDQ